MSPSKVAGVIAAVCLSSAMLDAAPIKVGSITDARFGLTRTLDGSEMVHTREKLLNTQYFGPSGVVRRAIEITDTGAAVGSITVPLLDQFDVFFVGWFGDLSPEAFTQTELDAFREWVWRGGSLIVVCDDGNSDAVCSSFGLPAGGDLTGDVVPADAAIDHPLVNGPFGAVALLDVWGDYSSFVATTGAVVIMRDSAPAQGPVVMVRRWGSGQAVLFTDVDIIASGATDGSAITNDNDRFLGNLFAFAARPYDLLIDAAAHTGGLSGTEWRSDVDLLNRSSLDASVSLSLLRVSQANLNPAAATLTVAAGQTLRLYDVLAGLFNVPNAALGLSFDGGEIRANSRFYNVGSADGTVYGMYIPSTNDRETVWFGRRGVFHHLSYTPGSTSGARVNIGGASRVPFAVQTVTRLYGDAGELLATRNHTFQPYEHRQFTKIHEALGTPAVTHGFATFEVTTPGGAVDAYAMLIENKSSDPIFMPPSFGARDDQDAVIALAGRKGGAGPRADVEAAEAAEAAVACSGPYHRIIAAAANTTGVNSTKWLSDVDLLNSGTGPAAVDIARLKANQANSTPLVASVQVPVGQTVRLANILGTLLPAGNAGLGVRFCSGEALVNSRFYNTGAADGKVYGMYVPSMAMQEAVTPCRPGVFHHLSYSPNAAAGQRINIGATNATDIPTTWVIRLYGDTGNLIGTQAGSLQPFEHRQYTNLHKLLGTPAVTNGWATVEVATPGAAIHPYAMRIENVGGDPIYMPAELEDATTSAAVVQAFTGMWLGGWENATFATSGDASLSLAFDPPNQAVTATLDLDGAVFGGADPPVQVLSGRLTPRGAVLSGVSPALGTYLVEIDGLCKVTGRLNGLPDPDIAWIDLVGTATSGEISLAYTVTFSEAGGGGTATGTLTVAK